MNEKKLEKGFFFGYGNNNFGYENSLTEVLSADLSLNEGCGIALIAGKHINFKDFKKVHIKITNNSNSDICIRIEKKFLNDVKTGFENISKDSTIDVDLILDDNDKKMKELVISALRVDNEAKDYTISIDVETY